MSGYDDDQFDSYGEDEELEAIRDEIIESLPAPWLAALSSEEVDVIAAAAYHEDLDVMEAYSLWREVDQQHSDLEAFEEFAASVAEDERRTLTPRELEGLRASWEATAIGEEVQVDLIDMDTAAGRELFFEEHLGQPTPDPTSDDDAPAYLNLDDPDDLDAALDAALTGNVELVDPTDVEHNDGAEAAPESQTE